MLPCAALSSRLHVAGADACLPPHPLPPELRLSSKLEMLDRILIKLHAGGHKVCHDASVLSAVPSPKLQPDTHPLSTKSLVKESAEVLI